MMAAMHPLPSPGIVIAEFRALSDTRPTQRTLEWPALANRLTRHVWRRTKDGPGWSPAVYRPGTTRQNESVTAMTALVLDCDHGAPPWDGLSGWAYAAHTTFQHTAEAPRWRVVLPLARSVPADVWPDVWERARAHLCPTMDAACKDPSRFYWWPSCPPRCPAKGLVHQGRFLSPSELPPVRRAAAPAPQPRDQDGDGGRPGDAFEGAASWESILEPHGWRLVYTRGAEGHWRRPGKREGTSATTNYKDSGLLWVFSSSAAPFEPGASYTKFGAFAVLEAAGDHGEAARMLAARGFGESRIAAAERPLSNYMELDR